MADTDDAARRLAEIRARADAVSPGWYYVGDAVVGVAAPCEHLEQMTGRLSEYLISVGRPHEAHEIVPAVYELDWPEESAITFGEHQANCRFIAAARSDIPYLLDLVAARDRELAELRGLLADLCEDSRAAAAAVRYRRALVDIAEGVTADPVTGRLESMTMDDARWFAKGQIEERR